MSYNIVFSSCGNDSVAVIQWAIENELENLVVAYSDTKWASPEWPERVERVRRWVEDSGGAMVVIGSEGFANLARRKKAFPANGMGFCSYELKIKPAMQWLDAFDPEKKAACYTGVMRIESERRKNWPVVILESENHGGRKLVSPLADKTLDERNALLERAGFDVLPYRSRECSPCINATIRDIQETSKQDLIKVVQLEDELGVGERSGKEKFMFRPHRMAGARGFKQVKEWADQGGGKYSPDQEDLFGCDSGFCE
jgi:3'-phosphoadenosine 5'-phosphosulfate sulfotransferase (PAPS reductase)/FAD synthetase